MSRELLGLFGFIVICIALTPFYKTSSVNQRPRVTSIEYKNLNNSIESSNPKTIVLLSDGFLPTIFAGSEISAFETIKYLRSRGHNIIIFVNKFEVNEYDGFKIYKYNENDDFCKSSILNCDIVFFQFPDKPESLNIIKYRKMPTYIFIHIFDHYAWILQMNLSFPVVIIYNSHTTQDRTLTLYNNMRMVPYVQTDKFKDLRELTDKKDVVCLINCNKNKGSVMFNSLAQSMPDVQFLGVKGAYGDQNLTKSPPKNLHYIDNQNDIKLVFKQIGILVMPSLNETWGRTAVEAMASGVPVIHSESPGLVECVGGAGILCMRDDKEAWENAIHKLINDRKYREIIRQNGFKRIQEIDIEQRRGRQELAMKIESTDSD